MNSRKRPTSPLIYPAAVLSAASLAWTTWSLVDLLGAGLIGVTVAAGADVVWGAVILAEARRLRIAGKAWAVPAVGWATLLAVAALLAWHGFAAGVPAMAVAGPLLPLGGKVVWVLALADMRDPAALTDDELHQLADIERGMAFDEARHRITMRRREMDAELHMAEVSVDFDLELMRQDKARELTRRRPLGLPVGGEEHAVERGIPTAREDTVDDTDPDPEDDTLPAIPEAAALPAAAPREVVTSPVALTPGELRRKARKLHQRVVAETGRPVTIDALRAEYGLSRRDAAELRRDIVEGDPS